MTWYAWRFAWSHFGDGGTLRRDELGTWRRIALGLWWMVTPRSAAERGRP